MRYGIHSEAMPSRPKNQIRPIERLSPKRQRCFSSRNSRANWCIAICTNAMDSGMEWLASHGEDGQKYSKARPLRQNSTRPNPARWHMYQKWLLSRRDSHSTML